MTVKTYFISATLLLLALSRSGTGCPDLGDFLVTPGLGKVVSLPASMLFHE